MPDGSVHYFNDFGILTRSEDRHGTGIDLHYDQGHLRLIVDAAGRWNAFAYDAAGHLGAVILPDGRQVRYGYVGDLLTSVVDTGGGVTSFGYDGDGRVAEKWDPRGLRVHHTTYGSDGRVVAQTDALGGETTFAWDPVSQTSAMVDAAGHVWFDVYHDNLLRVSIDPLLNHKAFVYDSRNQVVASIDEAGGLTATNYDAAGRVTGVRTPDTGQVTYSYRSDGQLSELTDAAGVKTTYAYDGSGRLDSITTGTGTPGQAVFDIDTDSRGLVTRVEDPLGRDTTVDYDAAGQVRTTCDPTGACTHIAYNAMGLAEAVTDALGRVTTTKYNGRGQVVSVTDPAGNSTVTAYDAAGNVVSVTDPSGVTVTSTYLPGNLLESTRVADRPPTVFGYDARGKVITVTDPMGALSRFGYDAAGQKVSETDPTGAVTRYRLNSRGLPRTVIDAEGGLTVSTFDGAGRPLTVTDPTGARTTNTYDSAGRLVESRDPNGSITKSVYDAAGRLVRVTDPRGKHTDYDYDAVGQLVEVEDPTDAVTTYGYDDAGRIETVTNPRGNEPGATPADHTTTTRYDPTGRPVRVTSPGGATTITDYDAAGNPWRVIDPVGAATLRTFDPAGRVETVTAPSGPLTEAATTQFDYDHRGDLVARVDPRDGVTSWAYDAAGRVVSESRPGGGTVTTAYDAAGRVASVTQPSGNATAAVGDGTTSYVYDRRGLVTAIDYSDPATPDVAYTYDAAGRRTSMTDAVGVERYSHDPGGRLTSVRRGEQALSYGYDTAGNITERVLPDGTEVTASFDDANRVATIGWDDEVASFDWLPDGLIESISHFNDVDESFTWDRDGHQTGWDVTGVDGLVTRRQSSYDLAGNPRSESSPLGTATFGYDRRHRLTSHTWTPGSAILASGGAGDTTAAGTAGFAYDRSSNVTSRQALGSTPRTATFDAADRSQAPGSSYDADGQLTTDGVFNYRYDAAGRLVGATQIAPSAGQGSYPDAVMADNPVGYWRLGTKTDDRTWPSALSGGAPLVAPAPKAAERLSVGAVSPDDGAMRFTNGQNQDVQAFIDDPGFSTAGAYTLEWFQRAPTATGNFVFRMRSQGGAWFDVNWDSNNTMQFRNAQAGQFKTTVPVTGSEWRHLAVVSDGTTVKWVVDGTVVDIKAATSTNLTDVTSGRLQFASGTTADLDDVAFYDHAVPIDHLAARATRSVDNHVTSVLADDPLGYWRLGEPQGSPTLADWSGNGNTGTIGAHQIPATTVSGAVLPDDGAVRLDGHDDTLVAAASSAWNLAGPHTISFAIRAPGAAETTEPILTKGSSNGNAGGWRVDRLTDGSIRYLRNGKAYISNPGLVGDTWTHVAITVDTEHVKFWSNGTLDRQVNLHAVGLGPSTVSALQVGANWVGPLEIDELALHATAIPGGHASAATATTTNAADIVYTYDGNGLLSTRTDQTGTTRLWWDTNLALPEIVHITSDDWYTTYVSGPTGPLAMSMPFGTYAQHNDRIGSGVAATNADGLSVASAHYTPYGDTWATTTPAWLPTRWAGSAGMDPATGLYNLRARWYDPKTAAFLTRDPVPTAVGDPYENPYTYTYGQPTTSTDPTGLLPERAQCTFDLIIGDYCFSVNKGAQAVWDNKWDIALNAITLGGYGVYQCTTDFLEGTRDGDRGRALIGGGCVAATFVGLGIAGRASSAARGAARAAGASDDLARSAPQAGGGGARFVANSAGDILDTTRIAIPEGKFGYLLSNPSKSGVFADSMGFTQGTLDPALRAHLVDNFGTATRSVPMYGGGTKFSVTGPMVGPSGQKWTITTAWGVDPNGTIRLITATP